MATQDIINYYANLLILQYVGKPKAYATIQALVKPFVADQILTEIGNAFELGTAVGAQLDVIGKYAGVTRNANTFAGPVTLNDADFTTLIQMAIIVNNAGSSLAEIQSLMLRFFNGSIRVYDYQDMRMSYLLNTSLGGLELAEVFVTDKLLPKPMGVQLSVLIVAADIDHFFGFRTYFAPAFKVEPFNDYASYQTTWPWLSYTNGVTP